MKKFYNFLLINLGILLVAIGVVVFKIPNEFATGGITGIAIILNKIDPNISVGMFMTIANIFLLLIALKFAGIEFEIKTIYATIVLSLVVWYLEKTLKMTKPLTDDPMLELFYAILFLAAGSAILFYQNASGGGTDIVAKLLNMKTHWHVGKTLLVVDLSISIFAIFIFGIKIGMYSVLGVIIKGFLIDAVIEGMHNSKQVVIISSKYEEIQKYIINVIRRGVTLYKAIGGNTNIERTVLNTIMSGQQAIKLRKYVMEIDDKAFIVVDNVNEIYGEGFKTIEL
jgi:uncharacterized membrane-anchored protein YitT (DUF2179 family)